MKRLVYLCTVICALILTSCGDSATKETNVNDQDNKVDLEQQKQDSLRVAKEKALEDSITEVLTNINVQIYIRTGVLYDSDGFAVEEGWIKEIKDFQSTKEYQITGMDDLNKLVITGASDKITIICSAGEEELYNSKEMILDGAKIFKGSGPNGGNGLDWVYARNRANDFKIKVLYGNDRIVFEGMIHPGK